MLKAVLRNGQLSRVKFERKCEYGYYRRAFSKKIVSVLQLKKYSHIKLFGSHRSCNNRITHFVVGGVLLFLCTHWLVKWFNKSSTSPFKPNSSSNMLSP
ncbi:unnamed protein product [Rotaria magnacalcarata]